MKNINLYILIIVTSILLSSRVTHAQYTTIKTPTNVSIEATLEIEYPAPLLAIAEYDAANWIKDHKSNAIRVAPASGTYNCHNYAWHSSDGGSKRWVTQFDRYGVPNLSKYWAGTNPTYQQVSNSSMANKAFYSNDDHSAIIISTNLYESKWGSWPKYQHSPSDCPYSTANMKYYYIPINGDNIICTSKIYTTLSIQNANYN